MTYAKKVGEFRDPNTCRWLTCGLFADVMDKEERIPREDRPFWLEADQLNDGRPVFRDVYLEKGDLTGAAAAVELLGTTEHLDYLLGRSPWFKEAFERFQKELKQRLVAKAQEKILELMSGEGSLALNAAKYIHSNLTASEKTSGAGRPSKVAVEGKLKEIAKAAYEDDADLARIQKHLN